MSPWFIGFYASITLMDIGMFEGLASERENETTLAAVLLLIFVFFVTVFCINLLIAKMASRYDEINRQSASYRRYQNIALIKQYKDGGLPSPSISTH